MTNETDFDLQPDPRILPMLGEINLNQWRCLAELIDNSVDGFLTAHRAGVPLDEPEILLNLPTSTAGTGRVTVRDNGPGMSPDNLERAVRAGWSGNTPIDSLGMFGMGFNISTARLGTITTVWTARKEDGEWHGLKIDFDQLRSQRHFRTPHLTRAKIDPHEHGTEITIERLKPDQRTWFTKAMNVSRVRRELARVYSSMLRPNGVPISFRLSVNGKRLEAIRHCTWGDTRAVVTTRWGQVDAIQTIDQKLPDRPYCLKCWQWLQAGEDVCPSCNDKSDIVTRHRHVHGWIGIQRFLSATEYGVDFVRNGRKIEIANKDLFYWNDEDSDEKEYPIDDPRDRGRIVGEVHLDHARVSYTKDRFDRTDPAWEEMVRIVRGDGPLRPERAAQAGFGKNESPLFLLFQAFRRSSPHNAKVAGGWGKVLVVKDNDLAEELAKKFQAGEPQHQDDSKWWELVEEEDEKLLTGGAGGGTTPGGGAGGGQAGGLPGFAGGGTGGPTAGPGTGQTPPVQIPLPPPRTPVPSLSRVYTHDSSAMRWDVRAFEVDASDPDLESPASAWTLKRQPSGEELFLIQPSHAVFQSITMTELDALLCQLAWTVTDFTRNQPNTQSFAAALAELRQKYAGTLRLDPAVLSQEAERILTMISQRWGEHIEEEDRLALFGELTTADQDAIYHKMATRAVPNPQAMVAAGRFLEYAPRRVLVSFFADHPELFFDGRCWEVDYSSLEYPRQEATDEARAQVARYYEALLQDAVWLSEQESEDLLGVPRERLRRAAVALDLLMPFEPDEPATLH